MEYNMQKKNYYTVHLKLMQYCKSIKKKKKARLKTKV